MILLETQGLTKTFGGIKANTDIDFALRVGQTMALIGPNGAGKSTFVGMLCGRIAASRGRVFFAGQNISALPAHKRIALGMAYTFQITSIFANLSVRANMVLAAQRVLPSAGGAMEARIDGVLAQIGLEERKEQTAADLSYGHQRMLEIAMGLVQAPRLLILDEPTQGLAESEINRFVAVVRALQERTTLLLIEHNMDVVMRVAQRITVLNFGRILAEGTPQEIQNNALVQAAYLGDAPDA